MFKVFCRTLFSISGYTVKRKDSCKYFFFLTLCVGDGAFTIKGCGHNLFVFFLLLFSLERHQNMRRSCNWFANDIVLVLNVKHITSLSSSTMERLEENWLGELIKQEVGWNWPCRMLFNAVERWLEINAMHLLIRTCVIVLHNHWSWQNHIYWIREDACSATFQFICSKRQPVLLKATQERMSVSGVVVFFCC